ncbi:hypothetical protein J3F83DRAFT_757244 [Trichoderma novae-zelandiae]
MALRSRYSVVLFPHLTLPITFQLLLGWTTQPWPFISGHLLPKRPSPRLEAISSSLSLSLSLSLLFARPPKNNETTGAGESERR